MNRFRFVHLNVHSHYSINDGCASIMELVDAAIKDRMPGIAITDNGNMFGVMEFFDYVSRINNERRQKQVGSFHQKHLGAPVNAGKVAEITDIDRKEVDKAFAELKKEGAIVSPVRCKWEPAK